MKRLLVAVGCLALFVTAASAVDSVSVVSGGAAVAYTEPLCPVAIPTVVEAPGIGCSNGQAATPVPVVEGGASDANNDPTSSEADADDDDTWLSKHGRLLVWTAGVATVTAIVCWACYQWWLKSYWAAELEAERQRVAAAQQAAQHEVVQRVVAQQQEAAQRIAAHQLAEAAQLVARTATTTAQQHAEAAQVARVEAAAATNQLAVLRANVATAEQRAVQLAEDKIMLTQEAHAADEAVHVNLVARWTLEARNIELTQQFAQAEARLADMQNQVQKAEEVVKNAVNFNDEKAVEMLRATVLHAHLVNMQQDSADDIKNIEKEYQEVADEFKQSIKCVLSTYTVEPGNKVRGSETPMALIRAKLRQFCLLDLGLDNAFWKLSSDQRYQRLNDRSAEFLTPVDAEKSASQKIVVTLSAVDQELDVLLQRLCVLRLRHYQNGAWGDAEAKLIDELRKKYAKGT